MRSDSSRRRFNATCMGQSLSEYGLILSLIMLLSVWPLMRLAEEVHQHWQNLTGAPEEITIIRPERPQ